MGNCVGFPADMQSQGEGRSLVEAATHALTRRRAAISTFLERVDLCFSARQITAPKDKVIGFFQHTIYSLALGKCCTSKSVYLNVARCIWTQWSSGYRFEECNNYSFFTLSKEKTSLWSRGCCRRKPEVLQQLTPPHGNLKRDTWNLTGREIPGRVADSGNEFNRKCSTDYWIVPLRVDCAFLQLFKARDWLLGSKDKVWQSSEVFGREERCHLGIMLNYFTVRKPSGCVSPLFESFLSGRGETTLCRHSHVIVLVTSSCLILVWIFFTFLLLCSLSYSLSLPGLLSFSLPGWKGRKTNHMTSWLNSVT